MLAMFMGAYDFDRYFGSWDASNVTDMLPMFKNTTSYDQDIGASDVSRVKQMILMLCKFLQPKYWILGCVKRNRHVSDVYGCGSFRSVHWILGCINPSKT
jgi:hypothetical protein